jgi:ArsR family transcriptional regulator
MKPLPLIEVYNCLCDETRLRIVHLLERSPLCVCHLQDILGLSQVAVSKHLAYLRQRGLVQVARQGQWMIYSLPATRPRELDWQLRCLQDCMSTHPIFRTDLRKLKAQQDGYCPPASGSTAPGFNKKLSAKSK